MRLVSLAYLIAAVVGSESAFADDCAAGPKYGHNPFAWEAERLAWGLACGLPKTLEGYSAAIKQSKETATGAFVFGYKPAEPHGGYAPAPPTLHPAAPAYNPGAAGRPAPKVPPISVVADRDPAAR